jgi:hypothetical protein
MSLGDMSEPLYGMPDSTTFSTQAVTKSVAPTGEWHKKSPFYILDVRDT